MKKQYPLYSRSHELELSDRGATRTRHGYTFESKKKEWLVTIRPDALSLQTDRYTKFEDFFKRLAELLGSVGGLLDTDFFTRVGLRYINVIPLNDCKVEGWVNPLLISAIQDGVLGSILKFHAEIRGHIEDGAYSLRHGIDTDSVMEGKPTKYILDFDYYSEGVETDNALRLVNKFHEQNFSLFRWSLGEKSKNYLE